MLAFDAKEFNRNKITQKEDPETHKLQLLKNSVFYTPLGVGVKIKENTPFNKVCLKRVAELAEQFGLTQKKALYDSTSLKEELAHRRALPFCDQLVSKLQRYVEHVHFTYVVMPPDQFPTVTVGGFQSPCKSVKSAYFLRCLQPMFSYISAWNYFGKTSRNDDNILLDGFNSKQSHAWNDLVTKVKPKIFPHGDECNPYIMLADIIAYLTDSKLYCHKKALDAPSLEKVWQDYKFSIETHYLDVNTAPTYGWYSDDMIDTSPYLAHPIIFLLVDELEKLQPNPPNLDEKSNRDKQAIKLKNMLNLEEQRFRKLVHHMQPWYSVTEYACHKEGSAQLFNYYLDRTKVQDGDTMVYIGNKSKEMAQSFEHMLDIEVLSAKQIRKNVNRKKD